MEEAKQAIRAAVERLTELAKTERRPREYYGELLTGLVRILAADGGILWIPNGGLLDRAHEFAAKSVGLVQHLELQGRHAELLAGVLTTGQDTLVRADWGPPLPEPDPTQFMLLVAAIKRDNEVRAIVEIVHTEQKSEAVQRGYMRFLGQMCQIAAGSLVFRMPNH